MLLPLSIAVIMDAVFNLLAQGSQLHNLSVMLTCVCHPPYYSRSNIECTLLPRIDFTFVGSLNVVAGCTLGSQFLERLVSSTRLCSSHCHDEC